MKNNKGDVAGQARRRIERWKYAVAILKDAPCLDCGRKYPPYVMDFDHREGTKKSFAISHRKQMSLKRTKEEAEKCDLVCSNCHRERTYQRLQKNKLLKQLDMFS